ncbi:MAG: CBS domain-containing protein, partial [Candidatus Diapherotrites archaeon]|nr:CBS domain-containing protein [Candidatus Diapherotrites archaeon]
VSESTPFNAVSALLDYNASVLVIEEGKIRGIISRSDLLGSIVKKQSKTN